MSGRWRAQVGWFGVWMAMAAAVGADRLMLTNGEVVEGIIEEETDDRILLNIGMGSLTFSKSRIERVVREPPHVNQSLADAWRIRYLDLSELPASMQQVAGRFEKLDALRRRAVQARGRLRALTDRIAGLEQLNHADLVRYRDVAAELRRSSKSEDLVRYSELAMEHNELISRMETRRAQVERAREASSQAAEAMIAYSHELVAFREIYARLEPSLRRDADVLGTAWLDRTSAQLTRFDEDFIRMEVPTRHRAGGTLVSVSINGAPPAPLLLDTGASVMTLTESLARRLDVRFDRSASVPLVLADGREIAGYPVMLRSVRVGDAQAENVKAVVVENGPGDGVEGLLGMSFLHRFEMLFDGTTGNLVLRRMKGL